MPVAFYGTKDKYGWFSNFSAHSIMLDGKRWPTTEHYFQAQKFAGTEFEERIRLLQSPKMAAIAGRDRKKPLRPDWEQTKDEIMRRAVLAKFTQHRNYEKYCFRRETRRSSKMRRTITTGAVVKPAPGRISWG